MLTEGIPLSFFAYEMEYDQTLILDQKKVKKLGGRGDRHKNKNYDDIKKLFLLLFENLR